MSKMYYQNNNGDIVVVENGEWKKAKTLTKVVEEDIKKDSNTLFKTINGESIVGEGNIEIQGGGTAVEANPTITGKEDNLTSIKIGDRDYIIPSGGEVDFDLKKELFLKYHIYLMNDNLDEWDELNQRYIINPEFTNWFEEETGTTFEDWVNSFLNGGASLDFTEITLDKGTSSAYTCMQPALYRKDRDPINITGIKAMVSRLSYDTIDPIQETAAYCLYVEEPITKNFDDTPTSSQVVYKAVSTLNNAIRNDFRDYEGQNYDKIRTYQIAMDTQDFYALAQNSRMIQTFMERTASSPLEWGLSFNIFKTQVWQNNLEVENFPVKVKTKVTPAEVSSSSQSPYTYELIVTDINPDEREAPEDPLPTRFYGTLTLWIYNNDK